MCIPRRVWLTHMNWQPFSHCTMEDGGRWSWKTGISAEDYHTMSCSTYVHSVSGTNFSIEQTALTVGGFTQPAVARAIIDTPGHAEKGLQQRYL